MSKIYYIDFRKQKLIKVETLENKEERLDPVLERVKDRMSPENFETYKQTVDHWMRENFEYQMERANLDGEEWQFHGQD